MTSLESKINNFVNQTGYSNIPCLPTITNYTNTNTNTNYSSYYQYSGNSSNDIDINGNITVLENLWDSYA
jgi:effector-binding domain-containing protein